MHTSPYGTHRRCHALALSTPGIVHDPCRVLKANQLCLWEVLRMESSPLTVDTHDSDRPIPGAAALTPRNVATGALVVVAIGLGFLLLVRFHLILFLLLVALIVATVTRPAVRWLAVRGLRPQIGVVLMYLLLLVLVGLFAALIVPLLAGQIDAVSERLPLIYADLRAALISADNRVVARLSRGLPADLSAFGAATAAAPASDGLPSLGGAWGTLQSTANGLFVAGAILVLAFYLVVEGDFITRRALLLVRPERRDQARELWAELEGTIAGFFRGQLILMSIIAVLSGVGYFLVGLPYALGLALIAGVCEVIPMIGPTIAMVAAGVVAISMAPEKLIPALLVGLVAQFLENNLLVPRVMDKSVGVNPIITIVAISAFGALFGVIGAVLSIPLAAMMQIIVQRLMSLRDRGQSTGRSRVSLLRLAAREVAADVRRGVSSGAVSTVTAEMEAAEDELESVATELDRVLAQLEVES